MEGIFRLVVGMCNGLSFLFGAGGSFLLGVCKILALLVLISANRARPSAPGWATLYTLGISPYLYFVLDSQGQLDSDPLRFGGTLALNWGMAWFYFWGINRRDESSLPWLVGGFLVLVVVL